MLIPRGFSRGSPVLLTVLVKNAHQHVTSKQSLDRGRLTGAQQGGSFCKSGLQAAHSCFMRS
jgi:hypothetical protein